MRLLLVRLSGCGFVVGVGRVFNLLELRILLMLMLAFFLFFDRTILTRIDYALLGTFIGFFVFIGNMQRIPAFQNFLSHIVDDHEIPVTL